MGDLSVMKSDKIAKRYTFGGVVRRTLSDITNSVSQQSKFSNLENEKTLIPTDHSLEEYMDHLAKENMTLARLVVEKNKIIELTGTELHKMRFDLQKMQINLQKLQLQNLNLAQTNNHILAEINIGKDKRKVLQHENLCKDALLKVKNEELKANMKIENRQKNLSQTERDVMDKHISPVNCKVQKTRRVTARSKSMGPTTSQPVVEKVVSDNKRRCLRRQSARLITQEQEPAEDLFEIEDAQFLSCTSADCTPPKLSSNSFTRKEVEKNENYGLKSDVFQSRRSSLGRPSRRAADKIQSYKEIPLNAKMRR